MIGRLTRIHREFGFGASARMVILIIGLIGMPILGVLVFTSWWPMFIVAAGLVAGFIFRRKIVEVFEWTFWALPAALIAYSILLFVGERLGISREAQLIIITLTTVMVFDLQFWSLSDPTIVKLDDEE